MVNLSLPEFQAVQEAVICAWETSKVKVNGHGVFFQVEYYLHSPFRKLKIPRVDYATCTLEHIICKK